MTEIIFAVGILAAAMIPIAGVMGHGFEITQRDQRQIAAIQLCQSRLNQAMALPFADLTSTGASISSGTQVLLDLGAIDIDNTQYTVSLDVADRNVSYTYNSVDLNDLNYDTSDPDTWVFEDSQTLNIAADVAKIITIIVSWMERGTEQTVEMTVFRANLEL